VSRSGPTRAYRSVTTRLLTRKQSVTRTLRVNPLGPCLVGHVVRKAELLDRDLAVQDLVPGPPHGAHPAAADLFQQAVAAGQHPLRVIHD
jgi:hypothetical protein